MLLLNRYVSELKIYFAYLSFYIYSHIIFQQVLLRAKGCSLRTRHFTTTSPQILTENFSSAIKGKFCKESVDESVQALVDCRPLTIKTNSNFFLRVFCFFLIFVRVGGSVFSSAAGYRQSSCPFTKKKLHH